MRQGGTSRHIPMLLATTFLVAGWNAEIMRVAAQDQPPPEVTARDANAQATSKTIVAGNRVQLVPFNQFSWWNKYQITPVWAAALGVIYFSDSFASSDDTVKLPGFVRFDTALYLKIDETWRAQLNVENLFNKGYWASADGNNNISPGLPRTVRLTAIAKF